MAKCRNCEELAHDGYDYWCLGNPDQWNYIMHTGKEHKCNWFNPKIPMPPGETDEMAKFSEDVSLIMNEAEEVAHTQSKRETDKEAHALVMS